MRWMIAAAAVLLAMLACGAGTEAARQPPLTGWLTFGNGPSRTGATAAGVDPAALRPLWFRDTPGVQTVQPLAVNGVPGRGQTTVYVATSAGRLVAYAPNGYVRWQRSLGVAPNPCPQLDGYGMTGTPVVDAATRAIYVADAFGLSTRSISSPALSAPAGRFSSTTTLPTSSSGVR
jgi:outer membrane protein assembly factor BamB